MTVVIGTAGHIDHGKTTLLGALTGIDTDRLPDEQRRGLTIDIGYAHFSPDGGPEIDLVDVPGHDKLVGNMLVGAGEIDACLLVVAADDGLRAQTLEHLALLDAIGIEDGIVAITKTDLVDSERIQAVTEEVRASLGLTRLTGSPIVAISATAGTGLDELRLGLATLRDVVAQRPQAHAGVWLAVDRSFSVRGRGPVVTGSSRGRPIGDGATLLVRPGPQKARLRGIQVHDAAVEQGPSGGRVALNLAGISQDDLHRGQLIVSPAADDDPFVATDSERMLVLLRRPANLASRNDSDIWPPVDGLAARLHIGTDQADAVIGRSGRDATTLADELATAVLRLDHPAATAVGERFVLRRPAPAGLLAGGIVLDPDPLRGSSRKRQTPQRLEALADAVQRHDPATINEALLALHGLSAAATGISIAPDVQQAVADATLTAVREHHQAHPEQIGIAAPQLRAAVAQAIRSQVRTSAHLDAAATTVIDGLLDQGELQRDGDSYRIPGHEPSARDTELDAAMDRLVLALDRPAPPGLSAAANESNCPDEGIRELERSGRIVRVDDDLAWSAEAHQALRDQAITLASEAPLTPAALRDATGTSRKYVMALLKDLDRGGILTRTPAGHIKGPRA